MGGGGGAGGGQRDQGGSGVEGARAPEVQEGQGSRAGQGLSGGGRGGPVLKRRPPSVGGWPGP